MPSIDSAISIYSGIAKVNEKRLEKLGIQTIKDLIFYFPFRYEDLSLIAPIKELKIGQIATVKGRVDLIHNKRSRKRRMYITEGLISDETGTIKVVWFNQPFMGKVLQVGDIVFVSGKVDNDYVNLQFTNPSYEKQTKNRTQGSTIHTARIVPVYPVTHGITTRQLRLLIKKSLVYSEEIEEWLPDFIMKKYDLVPLTQALRQVHFPDDPVSLEKALQRLRFDELFVLQLFTQKLRNEMKKRESHLIKFKEKHTKTFVDKLPYTLTDAQRKTSWEIILDMGETGPMNRLIEGDVGSGKTVVAALVILNVFLNKLQSAIMAPTEILAKQHFDSFSEFFKGTKMRIALVSRSQLLYYDCDCDETIILKKKEMQEKIAKNKVDLIIGTHALVQDSLDYKKLGLIIIDEQHRFGVKQRQILKEKAQKKDSVYPHFLSMTATPIPRSLALAIYGDLDLSIIDQMPKGRKKIITKLVNNKDRNKAYDFIREEIDKGRQCFIICPLITESDKLGVKSVEEEYKKLDKIIFKDLQVEKLHGKLHKNEKQEIMDRFAKGEIDILIATSVVEVGVNVPNATIMIIEGADRFGFAQLHQFRGRVGRADYQSYCFLFTDNDNNDAIKRLDAFTQCNDGFELAEKDLQMRGPGEVYGYKQSGMDQLKLAKLTDHKLIKLTRQAANDVLEQDPELDENNLLKEKILLMQDLSGLE